MKCACRTCKHEVVVIPGHRAKGYCCSACRLRAHREKAKTETIASPVETIASPVETIASPVETIAIPATPPEQPKQPAKGPLIVRIPPGVTPKRRDYGKHGDPREAWLKRRGLL